ncbi:GroES-like protein [Serendipita vermifera]|nr:GroES-like protein [Serendipita vermifera]
MKGVVLEAFNQPYVYKTDLSVPEVTPGSLLLKVEAAGLCHTDLLMCLGVYPSPLPMVPGHENVGVVAAIGDGVTGFQVGDRVGCMLYKGACGQCNECKEHNYNFCDQIKLAGLSDQGGMAEYILVDPMFTVKLPNELPFTAAAPLMCAGCTVYKSIKNAKQPKGAIVGIVGLGGLGHLGVQYAKAMGYRCVALDNRQAPIDLMQKLPEKLRPDLVINSNDEKDVALEKIRNTFPGATGLNAAVVCTDSVPGYKYAASIMAKHGTVVVVGLPLELPLSYSMFLNQDLTFVGGYLGDKSELQETVDIAVREGIHVELKEYKLEDVSKMIDDYNAPEMKGRLVINLQS